MSSTTLSLRPMPRSWATKILGRHPLERQLQVPTWLTRPQLVSIAARARELQSLLGPQFRVEYAPDTLLEDDDDAAGHLFVVSLAASPDDDELRYGWLDDRQDDMAGQLRAWLLECSAAFQAAAERVKVSSRE